MKLTELADITGSTIESGPHDLEITGVAGLGNAGPGEVTFLSNPKYTKQLAGTRASAVLLKKNEPIGRDDIAVLRTNDVQLAYTLALRAFFPEPPIKPSIHPTAVIDPTARLAENVEIHAYVVIGPRCSIADGVRIMPNVTLYENVSIAENTTIHSGVSIRENCEIGRNCTIHNNCTIGSDGFGYARTTEKRWLKIPQTGRVVLEDDIEVGANSAIDSPSMGETRVMRGVKVDNLVQIGHSVVVEEDSLLCAQVGLAGSSHIGKRVILAGQSGVADHRTIGDDAVLAAKAGAAQDVAPGSVIGGPSLDNKLWVKSAIIFRRLPEIVQTVRDMERRLRGLEAKTAVSDKRDEGEEGKNDL